MEFSVALALINYKTPKEPRISRNHCAAVCEVTKKLGSIKTNNIAKINMEVNIYSKNVYMEED